MIPRAVFWGCLLEVATALVLAAVALGLVWLWWR